MKAAYIKGMGLLAAIAIVPAIVIGAAPDESPETQRTADPQEDRVVLVDYQKVHEELDGGADSGVSPDGQWLSYSHSRSGNREVYAVHTESGVIRKLTNTPGVDWEARWHPDGTHIVFTANREGQNGVFIRNLETCE